MLLCCRTASEHELACALQQRHLFTHTDKLPRSVHSRMLDQTSGSCTKQQHKISHDTTLLIVLLSTASETMTRPSH